jgi:hypothetical protein
MAQGMKKQYKSGKTVCRDFTDGKKVCMSKRAWTVFFASINKMGAKSESPRPKSINETVFNETAHTVIDDMVRWIITRTNVTNHVNGGDKDNE